MTDLKNLSHRLRITPLCYSPDKAHINEAADLLDTLAEADASMPLAYPSREVCLRKDALAAVAAEKAKNATNPAWHDFPTVPGLWVCDDKDGSVPFVIDKLVAPNPEWWMKSGARWFGPIPENKP